MTRIVCGLRWAGVAAGVVAATLGLAAGPAWAAQPTRSHGGRPDARAPAAAPAHPSSRRVSGRASDRASTTGTSSEAATSSGKNASSKGSVSPTGLADFRAARSARPAMAAGAGSAEPVGPATATEAAGPASSPPPSSSAAAGPRPPANLLRALPVRRRASAALVPARAKPLASAVSPSDRRSPDPGFAAGFASPSLPDVNKVLGQVTRKLPERSAFPLVLVGLVVAFLLVQDRIDRREPKLLQSAAGDDSDLSFMPAPSKPMTNP